MSAITDFGVWLWGFVQKANGAVGVSVHPKAAGGQQCGCRF